MKRGQDPDPGRPPAGPESTAKAGAVARQVVEIRLDLLKLGLSPRGLDDRHVELLQECPSPLPPILVHRDTMTVVDGLHRFHAARRSGSRSIAVVWFDGSFEEAWLEAIRANVQHGKPLTPDERRRAAKRVLLRDPCRSDRGVAEICGLSPKTVAAVRLRASEEIPHPTHVTGRDGRRQTREHSRQSLKFGSASTDDADRAASVAEIAGVAEALALPWWETDKALASRCEELVGWLRATNPTFGSCVEMIAAVPASRTYDVAGEIRRRARILLRVADDLERAAMKHASDGPQPL